MDFTVFEYMTTIPDTITQQDWYSLALLGYNLGLTFFWTYLIMDLIDKVFICLNKSYRKGSD